MTAICSTHRLLDRGSFGWFLSGPVEWLGSSHPALKRRAEVRSSLWTTHCWRSTPRGESTVGPTDTRGTTLMDAVPEQVRDLLALAQEADYTDGELGELARRLSTARLGIERLKLIADMLVMEMAARVEADDTMIPHFGLVHRGKSTRSAWREKDSADVLRHDVREAVVKHLALDIATGELDPVKRNIARATVDAIYELLPSFSSVKAAAGRYGIRISDYREFTDAPTITFTEDL